MSPAGFGWLLALACISTVAAVVLFFAGLRRVGPSAASILSTLEPVVTVALAFAVFGEIAGAGAARRRSPGPGGGAGRPHQPRKETQ